MRFFDCGSPSEETSPPPIGTRSRRPRTEITISPDAPQVPPALYSAITPAATVCGFPPASDTRLIEPCAVKPTHSPSGEKNGSLAPLRAWYDLDGITIETSSVQVARSVLLAGVDDPLTVGRHGKWIVRDREVPQRLTFQ